MIQFTLSQIESFDTQERELFNKLVSKAGATIVEEEGKFDVQAYLAKKDAKEKQEKEYSQQLEESFVR